MEIYWETSDDKEFEVKERLYFSIPGFFSFGVGFPRKLTSNERAMITSICTNPELECADEIALDYPDLAFDTGLYIREEVHEKLNIGVAYQDSFDDPEAFFIEQAKWEQAHYRPGKWIHGGYKG